MKKTIKGNLEEINEQIRDLRKTNEVKISPKMDSNLEGEIGNKRMVHTVELELTEKEKQ